MYEKADAVATAQPTPPAVKAKKADDAVSSSYRTFCYRLLGQRYDQGDPDIILAERLKQAGLSITPGMHVAVVQVTTILALVASLAFGLVFFLGILHSPLWYGNSRSSWSFRFAMRVRMTEPNPTRTAPTVTRTMAAT